MNSIGIYRNHGYLSRLYSKIKKERDITVTRESLSPEDLELINSSPVWGYRFARSIFKCENKELENTFIKNQSVRLSYLYCRIVLKAPCSNLEPIISINAGYSYKYSKYVLHTRFSLGEPSILSNPVVRQKYINFLNNLNLTI